MPIYEYRCGSCSHELDALQKISDSPLRKCPACGKAKLTKLVSAPVFRLKGGGWYETDFKGDGDKKRNLVDTSHSESSISESSASSKPAESAKSDASAKADGAAKETKKPAEKPAASEVKKPRKSRAAGPTRT